MIFAMPFTANDNSRYVIEVGASNQEIERVLHGLLEALWAHQSHNVVDVDLLKQLLGAKDFRARAAATRVLCYWRDRVDNPLERLRNQVNDEHPRVRLEAAAS